MLPLSEIPPWYLNHLTAEDIAEARVEEASQDIQNTESPLNNAPRLPSPSYHNQPHHSTKWKEEFLLFSPPSTPPKLVFRNPAPVETKRLIPDLFPETPRFRARFNFAELIEALGPVASPIDIPPFPNPKTPGAKKPVDNLDSQFPTPLKVAYVVPPHKAQPENDSDSDSQPDSKRYSPGSIPFWSNVPLPRLTWVQDVQDPSVGHSFDSPVSNISNQSSPNSTQYYTAATSLDAHIRLYSGKPSLNRIIALHVVQGVRLDCSPSPSGHRSERSQDQMSWTANLDGSPQCSVLDTQATCTLSLCL